MLFFFSWTSLLPETYLMCWWCCLKLSLSLGYKNVIFQICTVWEKRCLGAVFFLYPRQRNQSECLFQICKQDIVSLVYSALHRHDLFCDLSIVLLRHSHGNLSGLSKSKSWWSAISFGNLSTLLNLCLLV